jgi:hypothetical protein
VCQVGLAGHQTQQLGVLFGNDLEHDAIEIRQPRAVRRGSPKARVAIEDEPLPWRVLAQHERTHSHELRWRCGRPPGLRERAGGERSTELVLRQDRKVVEQAHAGTRRFSKGKNNRVGVWCDRLDRLTASHHVGRNHTLHPWIERGLERKEHIGRGERRPIGPREVRTQMKGVGEAVGAGLPTLRQPGLDLEGRSVDAKQASLQQRADDLGGDIAGQKAVERPGLRAGGDDNLTAATGGG